MNSKCFKLLGRGVSSAIHLRFGENILVLQHKWSKISGTQVMFEIAFEIREQNNEC